jgi:glycosyltransferase involved in cell wall biosynthesis
VLSSFSDTRIKIINQENGGVSRARNAGLAVMTGAYFTFLDADDILPENSLELRVRFAKQHPSVDILSGSVNFFNSNGILRKWQPSFSGDPFQSFIRIDERAFCNPSLFLKRVEGVTYQFKPGMTHVEDLMFFVSVAAQKQLRYDHISEVVYHYRVSDHSAMSNLQGLEKGYWTFYDTIRTYPGALASNIRYLKWRVIRIMFLSYLANRQWLSAFKVLPKMFSK